MFTNPFNRKYQTGGSAPSKADSLIEKASKNSGISAKILIAKINSASSDESNGAEFAELIKAAASDEDTQERRNAIASLKKKCKSPMFADGGKFQYFICKHRRGGDIGCGCNGGKVVRGEDGIDSVPDGFLRSDTPVHAAALAAKKTVRLPWFGVGRRKVGAAIDQNGGKHFYEWGDINGNTAQTAVSIPAPGDTIVKQSVATNRGWIPNTYPQGSTQYETIMERFRPIVDTGVPYKEDGGVVSEQEGGELTRKQARILSRHNKGFNRGQFQLAMANADAALRQANPGIHGRELRQAKRRMVAGLNESPLATSATIESPILVAPSTGLVRSEVVETPKANVAQRSASMNRSSNIARREDYPMQEIVIPQISTDIPFGKGPQTSEKEVTPVIEVGPLTETRDWQDEMQKRLQSFGPWVSWGQGGLQEETPEKVPTRIVVSAPRRTYSAITGQPLKNGQSSWELFKQGGKINK